MVISASSCFVFAYALSEIFIGDNYACYTLIACPGNVAEIDANEIFSDAYHTKPYV